MNPEIKPLYELDRNDWMDIAKCIVLVGLIMGLLALLAIRLCA